MNVTEPPVKRWLSPDVASNGQNAPTQRLWDMRWLAILSAPLLLGTILLPLLASPIVRWTFRRYVKLGVFWRLIFVLIGLAYPALYYALVYSNADSFVASGICFVSRIPCVPPRRPRSRVDFHVGLCFDLDLLPPRLPPFVYTALAVWSIRMVHHTLGCYWSLRILDSYGFPHFGGIWLKICLDRRLLQIDGHFGGKNAAFFFVVRSNVSRQCDSNPKFILQKGE